MGAVLYASRPATTTHVPHGYLPTVPHSLTCVWTWPRTWPRVLPIEEQAGVVQPYLRNVYNVGDTLLLSYALLLSTVRHYTLFTQTEVQYILYM